MQAHWEKNCFHKTDKSWIVYRALTKIGLLANIDGPCNRKQSAQVCTMLEIQQTGPAVTKTFNMLNSAEHVFFPAHKC